MNCKESRLIIAGLTGDSLPDALAAHVEACPACAELLDVDARLRATLRSQAPALAPTVLDRVRAEMPLALPDWKERGQTLRGLLIGNTLMKITLPVTAALAAAFLVALPNRADAATPRAAFAKMRSAVLAKAKNLTSLDIKVGKTPQGGIGTWVVLDGELTQLGPNGSFHTQTDGKDITVKTQTLNGSDLSSLSPELRALVEKAIENAKNGSNATSTYIVNGKEVDAATAQGLLQQAGLDLKVSIDLDADDYRSIAFGADHDHLVLSPKNAPDRRTVVTLDPKSSLPRNVVLQRNEGGRWVALRSSNVTLR